MQHNETVKPSIVHAMQPNHRPHTDLPARDFATTRWSVVLSAGRRSSPDSQQALQSLCEVYWHPLYAYVRRRVADMNEAQDLTQAFIAELLEKNYVGTATPEKGKFRAYLLTALKHFLSKHWEKSRALKRGGGRVHLPLDFERAEASIRLEPAGGLTAEQVYERQWVLALLAQIMKRLEAELERAGKQNQFELLNGFLVGDHAGVTYAQVAKELCLSEAAAKKAASRMRQRYRELLREEIAETVADPSEIDREIRNLFAILEL